MLDLQGYESSILDGALVTLQVALLSLLLAVFLGLLGALAKMAPYRWARSIATLYTTIVRGIPDLVLMMLLFFGAYMAETFRGAIMAVDRGEMEAAKAYGMSGMMAFRRILFPQMIRHALPGFGNNWLVLLKTTALVSIIGLEDMVRVSSMAAGTTKMPFTFYMTVACIFLFFTAVSTGALKLIERKFSIHMR
ncbi:ABC transporter permease [Aliivibrio fischeri]|uniref:ABC transporter permease n=1 Tax=Aliivibrio fischeri TaxID=668 RepID=UPI0007C551CC|nr:ABC transporter permease subunit [Aliivibrio fischeri]MBP3157190.1 ABC transporter permease subunit [Aliivibrio fischeri]